MTCQFRILKKHSCCAFLKANTFFLCPLYIEEEANACISLLAGMRAGLICSSKEITQIIADFSVSILIHCHSPRPGFLMSEGNGETAFDVGINHFDSMINWVLSQEGPNIGKTEI